MLEGREFEEPVDPVAAEIERKKKEAVELLTGALKHLEQAENNMIEAAQKTGIVQDFNRIIRIETAVEDAGIDLTNAIERMM